ncbi:MAG: Holliday junction branch migration protein RuvA [Nitrospinota bacterium]
MIARIEGKLAYKSTDRLIVDVNGVGYQVYVPLSTYYALPETGEILQLRIITIVREDAFNLFGFLTKEEQEMFEYLINVSKIGPKVGLNTLSGMSANELKEAILQGDIEKINSIPGIGKKTAERIVLELKEKVGKIVLDTSSIVDSADPSTKTELKDALSALINLGYKRLSAESALEKVTASLKNNDNEDSFTVETLIKGALKILSGTR